MQTNAKNKEFKMYFHDANAEKMIGHYEKSIVLFEKCISIDPNSAASYFGLSQIYFKTKQNDKAIQNGEKATKLNPTNKWYILHLADIHYSLGNYAEAAIYLENVFKNFEEKNIDYRYQLAQCYIATNQHQKAIEQLTIIEGEYGKSPELSITKHDLYIELNEFELAKKEIQSLLIEFPNDIEIRLMVIDYYLQTNQVNEAEKTAKELLILDPTNGNAYLALADVEIRRNNIDLSFDYLEKGFSSSKVDMDRKLNLISGLLPYCFEHRDPNVDKINQRMEKLFILVDAQNSNDAKFYLLYGTYLEKNKRYKEAREKFAKSSRIDGSDYLAWNELLNVDLKIESYDSLYRDAEKSIEFFPSQPLFYLFAGIGAYELKKFNEADDFLYMGKNLVMKDPELKNQFEYHIGINYYKQNQLNEAEKHFEKLVEQNPNTAIFNYGYSKMLFYKDNTEKAADFAKKAIEKEGANDEYLFHYGKILYQQKNYAEAKKIIYRAVSIQYTNITYLEFYGDILFLVGEKDKALEFWKESVKQGNDSALIKKKIDDKKFYEN